VPVQARRGNQRRNAVDQLQWTEGQLICFGTAFVTAGLAALFGAAVDQLATRLAQPIHGKLRISGHGGQRFSLKADTISS
jgi:hypothetical protein